MLTPIVSLFRGFRSSRLLALVSLLTCLTGFGTVIGQDASPNLTPNEVPAGDCPPVVNQALTSLDATCNGLGRNSACYGSSEVSATFVDPADHGTFAEPADQIDLARLKSIRTSPLDESRGTWGLAMLNVQANVPDSLPGQGVIYILMGDAQLENQVENAPDIRRTAAVTTGKAANLRSDPSRKARVLSSVPAGTDLQVDVRSPDQKWLRVVSEGAPRWIHHKLLKAGEALPELPAPEVTKMSPMQVVRFTGGIGQSYCRQSQGSVLIQGPNAMVVDIEVNGVHIRIGSTIVVQQPAPDQLRVTVLGGAAYVESVGVPAGYYTTVPLDSKQQMRGGPAPAAPISSDEFNDLQVFDLLPAGVMHYLPTLTMEMPLLELSTGNSGDGGNVGNPGGSGGGGNGKGKPGKPGKPDKPGNPGKPGDHDDDDDDDD